MNDKVLDNYFFILFSFIPLSLIVGPAVSLINILLIDLSFICYILYKKDYQFLSNKAVKLILILCLYLIFNSIISKDFSLGVVRNFGFIRFGILFCAFNYFFYYKNSFNRIFIIWTVTLVVVILDTYIESFFGKNILGYSDAHLGKRIVSFFKDEAIVGGYINGFYLIIIGYFFILKKEFVKKNKNIILITSILFFVAIFLSGERSNAIKAFLGFLIFYGFNDNFKFKNKIFLSLFLFATISLLCVKSDYLKLRYGPQLLQPIIQVQSQIKQSFNTFFSDELKVNDKEEKWGKSVYLNLYKSGFNIFKENPLFGVGNKNYRLVSCIPIKDSNYFCSTHPHQTYFEFLAEHGLVGTAVLILILFNLIFSKFKIIFQTKNNIQIGCFAFLLTSFIPFLPTGAFFNDYSLTLFWVNLSLLYSIEKKTNIFSKKLS